MAAAEFNLTEEEGCAIHQGYDFGPIRFKLREDDFETLQLEVTSVGAEGDSITLNLFGSNSDRPELLTSVEHVTVAGEDAAAVASDIADAINDLREVFRPPEGDTEVFTFEASADGAVITFKTTEPGFHLDASVSVTGAATADLSVTVAVLVDVTGATVEASGKLNHTDTTKLFYWSTGGGEFTIFDALRGVIDLDVPRATTSTYTWEACLWEMSVLTATDDRRRPFFIGKAENILTLQ